MNQVVSTLQSLKFMSDNDPAEVARVLASILQQDQAASRVIVEAAGLVGNVLTSTWAGLPPASQNTGRIYRVTDVGSGGIEVVSNGTAWRPRNGWTVLSQSSVQGAPITGSTSAMDAALWNIPGGLIGANGKLMLFVQATCNGDNANTKYLQLFLNSTEVGQLQSGGGTNAIMLPIFQVSNRGAENSQLGGRLNNMGVGLATGSLAVAAENTAVASTLRLVAWTPTSASDFVRIESHTLVLVTPG